MNTGLSVDAIRFYEKEGLIPQRKRNAAGYRLYIAQDICRLRSIGRAQNLGFTLHEIRDLFTIDDSDNDSCTHVQEMIARKLSEMREKIDSLRQIENSLSRAQAHCRAVLSNGERCRCPVMQYLNDQELPDRVA